MDISGGINIKNKIKIKLKILSKNHLLMVIS